MKRRREKCSGENWTTEEPDKEARFQVRTETVVKFVGWIICCPRPAIALEDKSSRDGQNGTSKAKKHGRSSLPQQRLWLTNVHLFILPKVSLLRAHRSRTADRKAVNK